MTVPTPKFGSENPNWRGGRVVDQRGYILIRVGTEHHLADVRGYAYEHRLIAEKKIGRRLLPDEEVHHKDENRSNNDPDNIVVAANHHEHMTHHRKTGRPLRLPGQANPTIKCECGCSRSLSKFDGSGRLRRFITGHNPKRTDPKTGRFLPED